MFSVFWSNVLTVPLLGQVWQHSTFYLMYEHIEGIEHWTHGPATSIMTIISIYCILEGSGPLLVKIEEARHCQYFIMMYDPQSLLTKLTIGKYAVSVFILKIISSVWSVDTNHLWYTSANIFQKDPMFEYSSLSEVDTTSYNFLLKFFSMPMNQFE